MSAADLLIECMESEALEAALFIGTLCVYLSQEEQTFSHVILAHVGFRAWTRRIEFDQPAALACRFRRHASDG
jgi:hypothetical protein